MECLSKGTQDKLLNYVQGNKVATEIVKEIPLCSNSNSNGADPPKKNKKRPPSKYNQFVSKCMKDVGAGNQLPAQEAMKKCAKRWNKQKKQN